MPFNNSPYRNEKFQSRLFRVLSEIIDTKVSNANVRFITLSSIKISKDKHYINVFFTTIYNYKKAEEGLNNASKFIAKQLAYRLGVNPGIKINFSFDSQTKDAFKLNKLLDEVEK